jgi:hypothetical protein
MRADEWERDRVAWNLPRAEGESTPAADQNVQAGEGEHDAELPEAPE